MSACSFGRSAQGRELMWEPLWGLERPSLRKQKLEGGMELIRTSLRFDPLWYSRAV